MTLSVSIMYRCQICFDEIGTNGHIACTPCGHAFCSDCLALALQASPICPSCRAPIDPKHEPLSPVEAQALVNELCRSLPKRRREIERLGPRPIRLYLDSDEPENPPEDCDDPIKWHTRQIMELTTRLGQTEGMVELARMEKSAELEYLQVKLEGFEERVEEAEQRAEQKERDLEEREKRWNDFFKLIARERVALENALWEKDKELQAARKKNDGHDDEVRDLKQRLDVIDQRETEHLLRIGEAVDALKRKEKKLTRCKAALQLAGDTETNLRAEIERLKAANTALKHGSLPGTHSARKPLEPLSPNSQRSDPPAARSDEEMAASNSRYEDHSLEVVSAFDDGDLDPSMDLTVGGRKRVASGQDNWYGAMAPPKRQKLAKLPQAVQSVLDPRTGRMKPNVVTGPGHRLKPRM